MDNEIDRIYSKIDRIDAELINLKTSMAKAEEQIKKLEYSEAQHATELSNTRHLLAECSSSIDYITRQMADFSEQRNLLVGATGKVATFELLFDEKIKNMSVTIDRVKENLEFSVEKVKLAQESDSKAITTIKTEVKNTWRVVFASVVSFALWVIRQFGAAKGWW